MALHREAGIEAERVPLSGAAGGSFAGDVIVAGAMRAEVKARANGEGFATLERWLGSSDLLFLRRDRAAPLVLMPWGTYRRLLTEDRPHQMPQDRSGEGGPLPQHGGNSGSRAVAVATRWHQDATTEGMETP